MRRYESVVILDPEMPDDDIRSFTEKYSQLIKSNGGEIIKIEDWGFKRLAYLVKRKEKGRYILFDFVGLPALITELERQFKITEQVLKFLSVKIDEDVDLEAFKAAEEEKAAAAAAAAAARRAAAEPAPAEPATPAITEPATEPAVEPVEQETAPAPETEAAPATSEAEVTLAAPEAEATSTAPEPEAAPATPVAETGEPVAPDEKKEGE